MPARATRDGHRQPNSIWPPCSPTGPRTCPGGPAVFLTAPLERRERTWPDKLKAAAEVRPSRYQDGRSPPCRMKLLTGQGERLNRARRNESSVSRLRVIKSRAFGKDLSAPTGSRLRARVRAGGIGRRDQRGGVSNQGVLQLGPRLEQSICKGSTPRREAVGNQAATGAL
jgi:hypothetical protein